MEKRKPGIYTNWYIVEAKDRIGCRVIFAINKDQAKTYAQAVNFWNREWGKFYTATLLRSAKPLPCNIQSA